MEIRKLKYPENFSVILRKIHFDLIDFILTVMLKKAMDQERDGQLKQMLRQRHH